jgi:hypothetical protein
MNRPNSACKFCWGIGYDASGQRCDCTLPAKVARVGKAHIDPPAPPGWREWLKRYASTAIVVVAALYVLAVMAVAMLLVGCVDRVYDCGKLIGGWHPDASPALMRECKEVRT